MASLPLLIFCVFHTLTSIFGQKLNDESPTVQISQGFLRGSSNYTADGTKFYEFLGIPYAKPPVGDLRFLAPGEPDSWSGERDATKFGPMCYQVEEKVCSEDCLFVNVFTPQLPTNGSYSSLLPVMVYIHGGAFVTGSGNMAPGQLMNYGVVLVTINYRLNVFGFLSIDGTQATGNAGLKDQSAALRWVQKNIAIFGGDPLSVTIFGPSAGGASVHYNILSPMSKGLFHRAISESGCALNPWAFARNTEERAYRLGEVLGVQTSSAMELIQLLKTTPAADLVDALGMVLTAEEKVRLISFPFIPSLEFARGNEQPFLPNEPSHMQETGMFNKVPYVIGVTKQESTMFVMPVIANQDYFQLYINQGIDQVVPLDLGLGKGSEKSLEVARKVISFYFGGNAISNATVNELADLQTDLLFNIGVSKTIQTHYKHSTSPTFVYHFVYGAAFHTMEMMYVTYGGKTLGATSDDVKLARLLGGLWTSFAKTGMPTVEGEVTWQPVTQDRYLYLEINTSLSMKSDLVKDRMDFWLNIYNEYTSYSSTFRSDYAILIITFIIQHVATIAITI